MRNDKTYLPHANAVFVFAASEAALAAAQRLALHLGTQLVCEKAQADALLGRENPPLMLTVGEQGLLLSDGAMTLQNDYSLLAGRLAQGRLQKELLVRAARIKGISCPSVIDATAGLGQDSLLLAAAGFEVTLYENDPIIAVLLRDGITQAAKQPKLSSATSRMQVIEADSTQALCALAEPPDVVYLDPMFPEKRKSSATKKKFQLLHRLESPCADEAGLLEAALAAHPRKVVVKRPLKGPSLGGHEPGYSLRGKTVRYDVIALPRA